MSDRETSANHVTLPARAATESLQLTAFNARTDCISRQAFVDTFVHKVLMQIKQPKHVQAAMEVAPFALVLP